MRIRALLPTGVRWRLAVWVAAVMVISAAVTFVVVYRDTGHQLRVQVERDVRADAVQLSQTLLALRGRSPARIAAAAARYVRAQPYNSTSTLLFARVPGAAIVSNHPELFGSSRPDPGETAGEQSAENALARGLLHSRLGFSTHRLVDVGEVRVLERPIDLGGVRVLIGAGEPLELVARAQRGVARSFILAGALTLALALLASYLAGARISAPLRRMAGVAARVDAGDLEPRMVPPKGRRDEIRVLAEAFNHMLDRLSVAFAQQHEFIADASHELRTPLTVIQGQIEVLAAVEDPSPAEIRRVERLVGAEIGRISRLVDDLLLLAQSGQTDFLRVEPISLRGFIMELWHGISATANRRFEISDVPDGVLVADPDRLAQALRNLLRNAIDHTDEGIGLIRLELTHIRPDRIRFTVIDDGPGVPSSERERIFERFHRTDPARTRAAGGAGLGLAIVRAIADAHGGTSVARAAREDGGARFELELPRFQPDASPGVSPDRAPSRTRAARV